MESSGLHVGQGSPSIKSLHEIGIDDETSFVIPLKHIRDPSISQNGLKPEEEQKATFPIGVMR